MSEPNALEVSLDTLQFKVTQREDVTSAVTLRHPGLTDQDLAFKVRECRAGWIAFILLALTSAFKLQVKTTHPRKYLVRPNEGNSRARIVDNSLDPPEGQGPTGLVVDVRPPRPISSG